MRTVAFKQVDVFTGTPFHGNPVAVVLHGQGLDETQMQRIAHWTNLSETAFLLPPTTPEAGYRVRIFTPRQELPFAGHPSVGAAHAAIEAGLASPRGGALVQECAAGLLPVAIDGVGAQRRIFVRAPAAKFLNTSLEDDARLADALGVAPLAAPKPRIVDNGPLWWVAGFDSAAEVRALRPDMGALAALTLELGAVGVAVHGGEPGGDAALAVRCFCPADGIPEDPVTGSGNAAVAAFLQAADALPAPEYVASQGRELGRDGYVALRVAGDGIHLGGHAVTVVDGSIRLE